MTSAKKTCFVVMGFAVKVDLATGRHLNLDASYYNLIKPAVEEAGLECFRADEVVHSGNINVPMYERILTADLVIADLSTSNSNAFYELGVRHALRPHTTIIIAEEQFNFPFDIAQVAVRKYKHLGDDIGVSEAKRFRAELKTAVETILAQPTDDSPVYTFLRSLRRLKLPDDLNAEGRAEAAAPAEPTHSALMLKVAEAKRRDDFVTAKALLSTVRALMREKNPDRPEDPYIIQQLALATYKSKHPTPLAALEEARDLLRTLGPETSNDTETLGLWGAVHEHLWEQTGDGAYLDEAVRGYERGFRLRSDRYNGINFAFLLNARAAASCRRAESAATPEEALRLRAEAVACFVHAAKVRGEVLKICEAALEAGRLSDDDRYWLLATTAEACLGAGDDERASREFEKALTVPHAGWMEHTTRAQMRKLRSFLADSPLKYIKTDTA